jgi:ABC-type lipoprotein release transport system permease subunit
VLTAFGERTDQPADAEPGMIVGVDVELESQEDGLLASLERDERPSGKEVAVGRILATRLGIRPGQRIALIGQDADEFPQSDLFMVKALVKSPTDIVNRLGVVMSLDEAQAFLALPDQAHEIVVQGDDPRKAAALAEAISALPSLAGAKVLSWREAAPELVKMIDMKDWVDLIFVAILFVAAAAGIANTMMMSTFERTREFGMLLALGTRPARIVKMIFVESVILGLVGVAIGSVIGTALVLITGHYGINYAALGGIEAGEFAFRGLSFSYILYPEFELRQVLYGVFAVTVTAILAATWPAVVAARLEPAEAIRS